MILKNVASQGVYLYAVDTSASPYGPKTGDAANITGSVSLDGGARAAFGTTNPTQIDATNQPGVYWQPLAQAETNGNAYAFSWKSSTSSVLIQPVFNFTSGVNLPAVAAGSSGGLPKIGTAPFPASGTIAAGVCDEVNTVATHNVNNSLGKQVRLINPNSDVIYSSTLPSQSGVTTTQVKLDSGASSADNAYQWNEFSCSGTGQGSRICLSYTGATRLATVDAAWTVAPVASDVIEITPTANVRVVSYATGQDPATLVLVTAANKLTTDSSGRVNVNPSQALSAARNVSAVADTSLTVNDAWHCAIAAAAGQETQVATTYTIKTPSTGTTLRIFTLDSASSPASRT